MPKKRKKQKLLLPVFDAPEMTRLEIIARSVLSQRKAVIATADRIEQSQKSLVRGPTPQWVKEAADRAEARIRERDRKQKGPKR